MISYGIGDFKRALILCGIVGTWLVAVNQGSELASGHLGVTLYQRIVLDFATPFAVSSLTAVLRNRSDRKDARK